MTVLQTEAGEADALTLSPPSEIIANTGTSDIAATLMVELRKYRITQTESMVQLTKIMTTFFAKYLAGEPTGSSDKDRRRGRGRREKKINPLAILCKICGKGMMHNETTCWELEANAATRPTGWPFSKI